jgi:hypothetical protein
MFSLSLKLRTTFGNYCDVFPYDVKYDCISGLTFVWGNLIWSCVSVVYRDVTRQAKGLYRLKHVGALWSGLAYLSRYNSGWFCHIIHNILNIITNHFKLKVNLYKHCLNRQAKQLVQVHSGRKFTHDYTRREGWHQVQPEAWCHSGGSLPAGDGSHSTDQPNGTEVGHAELSMGFSKVIPEK